MQKTWVCCAVLILLVLGSWQSAAALWCENRLVSSGDTAAEVLFKCGPPTVQQQRDEEIEVLAPVFFRSKQVLVTRRILVTVEEWIYNFGPHSLLYVLTLHNGRVTKIHTRGYGY